MRRLLDLLGLVVVVMCSEGQDAIFSGFYRPDISHNIEPFASSWLVSKEKFLKSKNAFSRITNFEGTVFSVLGRDQAIAKSAIMTRDYFDFQVEHMSSTINTLEDDKLYGILGERLRRRANKFRVVAITSLSVQHSARTVAVIPFSSSGAHSSQPRVSASDLRVLMFVCTFWSLKRYGFEVVVSVSSDSDLVTLKNLNLPLLHIYTFFNTTKKSQQPKLSLMEAVSDMTHQPSWQKFEFVFYSDADQILHMRNIDIIYDTLLQHKMFVICPHRLHTMALPKDVPKYFRYDKHFTISGMIHHTMTSHFFLEDGISTLGSCCDDGRFVIMNKTRCSNFWYFCDELHDLTMMEWVKFGPHGFTAPLTTEHMGKCRYFPSKRRCDLPKACTKAKYTASDGSVICGEISKSLTF